MISNTCHAFQAANQSRNNAIRRTIAPRASTIGPMSNLRVNESPLWVDAHKDDNPTRRIASYLT